MSKVLKRISLMFVSQRKSWQKFAADIEAEFFNEGIVHPYSIVKTIDGNEIKISTFNQLVGRAEMTGTQINTVCEIDSDIEFLLTRKTLLSKLLQGNYKKIDPADEAFSKLFVIYGINKKKTLSILNAELRQLIKNLTPYNDLTIEFKKHENGRELKLSIYPVIKDQDELQNLFLIMEKLLSEIKR